MKKMKKLLSIVLSAICTVGVCLNFSACNDEKYQVSKEEYEAAFRLRRSIPHDSLDFTEKFISTLNNFNTNEDFIANILKRSK